ncbi:hypothetical protein ACFQO7_32395 [Catellatospora aurea]|uniref:DUF3558 domain-containing protein n=1 Tax=Catellatospora aurea TaxID=1337874 RepID=A0ABW2H4Y1_9ACTN
MSGRLAGETGRQAWWRRHRRTVAGIALLGVGVGVFTAHLRGGSAQILPPAPEAVCPLLRAEVLDLLVPGRDPSTQETDRRDETLSAWCVVQRPKDDGENASLVVGVINVGRADGEDPVTRARRGFSGEFPFNRDRVMLDGLGDQAGYWSELGPAGRIYLTVRVGARLVHVQYRNTMVGPERSREAAVLAAREVLAKL